MTPARKTSAILATAAAVAVAALFLTRATPSAAPVGPTPAPVDASGLRVEARTESSHVLMGTTETHMAITLQAPEMDHAPERPPLNVALVIDRSSSMHGDKLRDAKRAALQLVEQLTEADRFSVVVYGSDVEVVLPSQQATEGNRARAFAAIDRIYDAGNTLLSGGLESGRDQILAHPAEGAVSRIVLISDGKPNRGVSNPDRLAVLAARTAERGVSITTVGVGLGYDENIMQRIATSGRGNYYFAETGESLAGAFADELGLLGATFATDVSVTLSPADGVEIVDVYGYPMERVGRDVVIPVADLHAGELRKVVLRVAVSAERAGAVDLADVAVGFRPVSSQQSRVVHVAARASATDSRDEVRAGRDADAIRHIERARTARAINQATERWEAGEYEAAQQIVRGQVGRSASLANEMDDEDLAEELEAWGAEVEGTFQAAPTATGAAGDRGAKTTRKNAYDKMR